MHSANFITKEERDSAKNKDVSFEKQQEFGIRAPHFVIYVREILEKEFGKDTIEEGGLRVITSLDWDLQKEAEEIALKYALDNNDRFNAENAAIVATDPNTGEILVMVGSRNYFDDEIQGNYNIATAERQPGSAFKPFVYAEAFNKGYRPETIVFDLPTEFSTTCSSGGDCYSPMNYDDIFRGPMSLRDALSQSVNIPAVKVFYLSGLRDSLNLAKKMGIETLTNIDQYGLTLVLGGGEVRPLDMASAYGVFASEGKKYSQTAIIRIEDRNGNKIYESPKNRFERVLSENTSRIISDVLSDNTARTPAFGSNSFLHFEDRDVAVKTGTTNDYRDAWIVGYTPNISVAAWAGNNDNSSMEKRVAGFIVAPMWNEFMQVALDKIEHGNFNKPENKSLDVKPIIGGFWKGERTEIIEDDGNEQVVVVGGGGGIHSILHWVYKNDPLGPIPNNPSNDPQYDLWESPVRQWVRRQNISDNIQIHDSNQNQSIRLIISSPENNQTYLSDNHLVVIASISDGRKMTSGEVFINNQKVGDFNVETRSFAFIPEEIGITGYNNRLMLTVKDELGNTFTENLIFGVR